MRVNPRLLGLALGLSRPTSPLVQRLNWTLPSPLLLRRSSSSSPLYLDDHHDPAEDRPAKDVEREETAQRFADQSRFFPHHEHFTPSKALEGERDFYFPPDFSSLSPPTPRTGWPGTPDKTADGAKVQVQIDNYRQAYKAYLAIEKSVLAKPYEREGIVHGPGELQRAQDFKASLLQKALEEEAAVERLRKSPLSNELIPRRILAAVPWTTTRFRMSGALVADAFVEFRGVDITRAEGEEEEDVDPETGLTEEEMAKWEKKMKRKNTQEKTKALTALKSAYKKKHNQAITKELKDQTWLSLVFGGLPVDKIRLEDWNAAIRYYKDLEVEVREAQALEFRREYRKRANGGFAETDALKGIADPGDQYGRRAEELEREPLSLDRFLEEEEGGEEARSRRAD